MKSYLEVLQFGIMIVADVSATNQGLTISNYHFDKAATKSYIAVYVQRARPSYDEKVANLIISLLLAMAPH